MGEILIVVNVERREDCEGIVCVQEELPGSVLQCKRWVC